MPFRDVPWATGFGEGSGEASGRFFESLSLGGSGCGTDRGVKPLLQFERTILPLERGTTNHGLGIRFGGIRLIRVMADLAVLGTRATGLEVFRRGGGVGGAVPSAGL